MDYTLGHQFGMGGSTGCWMMMEPGIGGMDGKGGG